MSPKRKASLTANYAKNEQARETASDAYQHRRIGHAERHSVERLPEPVMSPEEAREWRIFRGESPNPWGVDTAIERDGTGELLGRTATQQIVTRTRLSRNQRATLSGIELELHTDTLLHPMTEYDAIQRTRTARREAHEAWVRKQRRD